MWGEQPTGKAGQVGREDAVRGRPTVKEEEGEKEDRFEGS